MARNVEEKAYRAYLTDALRSISENTARYSGGCYLRERYVDILERKPPDTRTAEEIAADVIKRAGLVVR